MTQDVKPTRSELMELKRKIKLAKNGHRLLKKKRDGLILDFFEILKKVKTLRAEIVEEYRRALERMNLARMLLSDVELKAAALAVVNDPRVEMSQKNIMGVVVPNIKEIALEQENTSRGYGLYTSAAIDEAALGYERVVERIVRAAEIETGMRKLLKEIEKTKRRVNALEFEVIPKMERVAAFIQLRLEEAERENVFRLKRIKKK